MVAMRLEAPAHPVYSLPHYTTTHDITYIIIHPFILYLTEGSHIDRVPMTKNIISPEGYTFARGQTRSRRANV